MGSVAAMIVYSSSQYKLPPQVDWTTIPNPYPWIGRIARLGWYESGSTSNLGVGRRY
ncbi:hypothetical protein CYLTODRAFT_422482 [Cylindrobasidium torrendii FP15055 ss-10]|uniref:Uncharacterized protein n=1 Tax=Cylindrobasidium torrendii FP15055 ss-10 TaxID=1314674 RepID=A0A0D7BD88_9AGAR|nr:hypothetical protein CYLTODRAFT_422482 [Cylindrobasidium torrendii FP15055 ss-10]